MEFLPRELPNQPMVRVHSPPEAPPGHLKAAPLCARLPQVRWRVGAEAAAHLPPALRARSAPRRRTLGGGLRPRASKSESSRLDPALGSGPARGLGSRRRHDAPVRPCLHKSSTTPGQRCSAAAGLTPASAWVRARPLTPLRLLRWTVQRSSQAGSCGHCLPSTAQAAIPRTPRQTAPPH
jgi:hypothetical protein